MHAVLKPCSASPKAARRPAPPAPTTTASYSWSMILYDDLVEVERARRDEAPNERASER